MATTHKKILGNHLKVNNGAVVTIFRLFPVILTLIEYYNVDEFSIKRTLNILALKLNLITLNINIVSILSRFAGLNFYCLN